MADRTDIAALRLEYGAEPLDEATAAADPFDQFNQWLDAAVAAAVHEPNAMVLATVGADGTPSARNVLLKGIDDGFQFFTNLASRKARELDATPRAALVFSWLPIYRQVLVRGTVEHLDDGVADAYFTSRPRGAQLGAWASRQSEPLDGRAQLEAAVAEVTERFEGRDVPRPDFWGGFRLRPDDLEFWQGRRDRLHDRLRYTRVGGTAADRGSPPGAAEGQLPDLGAWRLERLSP